MTDALTKEGKVMSDLEQCKSCGGMGVIDTYPGGCECCVEPEEIKCPVCDGEVFTPMTHYCVNEHEDWAATACNTSKLSWISADDWAKVTCLECLKTRTGGDSASTTKP